MKQIITILGCILAMAWVFWGLPERGHTLHFDLILLAKAYSLIAVYAFTLWRLPA